MQARTFKRSAIAIAVAGAFAVGVVTADRVSLHSAQAASTTTAAPAVVASNAPMVALPDFSALVEQYGPAVVNISVSSDGTKAAARQDSVPQIPEELAPFFRGMPRQQPGPMRGQGSGFIIDAGRHHHDQRARRRRCRRSHGQARRQARIHGQGARQRQDDRRRRAEDRREESADGEDRQSRSHARRRMGRRDRHAVRTWRTR